MFVWVPKGCEADMMFLKEVFGACGTLASEMEIESLGGYIFEEHTKTFKDLGFEIGRKEPHTRILL